MTATWEVQFTESVAEQRAEALPVSHLSIEVGHLYFEEFLGGEDALARHFESVAPWIDAMRKQHASMVGAGRPRVSTCFLIDDYFTRFSSPATVLPMLVKAAEKHDVVIDYIARESACVQADGIPIAELVLDRLVPDPVPGTTGVRPPTTVTGWLCNGQRSPNMGDSPAMSADRLWRPPSENGAVNHSVYLDVELWSEDDAGIRTYSCSFLAAVWQLLRLGLLRHRGAAIAAPQDVDELPEEWDRLPAIVRVNPSADPFSAYRSMSILGARFLPIEHAVRTVLQQTAVERPVADQVRRRSSAERVVLPAEVWKRIGYSFLLGT